MGIFDFFFSKPKVNIFLNKEIFNYGDFIEGKINIESSKTLNFEKLNIDLVFNNDSNDRITGFYNDYNREYNGTIADYNGSNIINFNIKSPAFFNEAELKEYFDNCKNNPDYSFSEDKETIIDSFLNPDWKIECKQLGFKKEVNFNNLEIENFIKNYDF